MPLGPDVRQFAAGKTIGPEHRVFNSSPRCPDTILHNWKHYLHKLPFSLGSLGYFLSANSFQLILLNDIKLLHAENRDAKVKKLLVFNLPVKCRGSNFITYWFAKAADN